MAERKFESSECPLPPPAGHQEEVYGDDILIDSRSGTVVIRAVGDGEGGQ